MKECYQLAMEENIEFYMQDEIWTKLWQVHIPSKIQIFIWRVLRGTLPCNMTIISSRRVDIPKFCPVCRATDETILHVLYHCSHEKSVWLSTEFG